MQGTRSKSTFVLPYFHVQGSDQQYFVENEVHFHMSDDDADDRLLFVEALAEARVENKIDFTVDGEDLMDYLRGQGKYSDNPPTLPDVLLLDLNMPRKDGRECIREIREDPDLRHLPIVVMTTSQADEDILRSYQLGVNSFIQKPVGFQDLVEVVSSLTEYWIKFIRLPSRVPGRR